MKAAVVELLSMVRPHRLALLAMAGLVIVQASLNVGAAVALKMLVDRWATAKPLGLFYGAAAYVAALMVLTSFLGYGITLVASLTAERILTEVRARTFGLLLRLPQLFFDKVHSGGLSSNLMNDLDWIRTAVPHLYQDAMAEPLILLALASYLLYLDPRLFGLSLLPLPLLFLPVLWTGPRSRRLSRKVMDRLASSAAVQQESLHAASVIKVIGAEEQIASRYRDRVERTRDTWKRLYLVSGLSRPITMLMAASALLGVGALGYISLDAGRMSAGGYVSFLAALTLFYRGVARMGQQAAGFMQAMGALSRVLDLRRRALASFQPKKGETLPPGPIQVQVSKATFTYPGQKAPALNEVDLSVAPGQLLTVAGPSGSGKSTLIKLIAGLYVPDQGEVRLNGLPPHRLSAESLAWRIGYVDQEVTLFDDSLRFNLTLGRAISEARLWEALGQAALADRLRELGIDLETRMQEGGHRLSKGERSRLALARCLAAESSLYLLDEVTGSLDEKNADRICRLLQELAAQGKTILLVSHRPETADISDKVLLLNHGNMVETPIPEDAASEDRALPEEE